MLRRALITIPDQYHVDIQDMFRIKGGRDRDGMGDLAKTIIDSSYEEIKGKFPKDNHNYWEWKPLDPANLKYAAIDGYVSYELYRRILDMKKGLRVRLDAEPCHRCRASSSGSYKRKNPGWPKGPNEW